MRQVTTLAIIEENNKVLLAMKKRGFGEGWWNGYGGKVQEGETIEEAMVRELREESGDKEKNEPGITALAYRKRAVIEFLFQGTDAEVEMHIFEVTRYKGEAVESQEMRPQWFLKKDIPYSDMWPADRKWMPLLFEGKDFTGRVVFDGKTKTLILAEFQTN